MKNKTPQVKVEIKCNWEFINIYINDILHLQFPNKPDKIVLQSWRDVSSVTKWVIQWVNFDTGKVIMIGEYDNVDKWKAILKEWDLKINQQ